MSFKTTLGFTQKASILLWCTAVPQRDRKYIKDKAAGMLYSDSQSKCFELQIKLEVSYQQ